MGVTSTINNPNMQRTDQTSAYRQKTSQGMDPFGKLNPKARKVIENVERQRQTPAIGVGSTGGSFDDEMGDYRNKTNASPINMMNNTTQNFFTKAMKNEN